MHGEIQRQIRDENTLCSFFVAKGYSNSEADSNLTLNARGGVASYRVTNKRLFMRDCSTCRDSRGLITRTCIRFVPTLLLTPFERRRACLRRASDQRRTRPTLRNPQDQSIPRFLRAPAGIVSAGKSRRLCVLRSRMDPPPPRKLRLTVSG